MSFWLRLALLLAPAEFRRRYGEEIAAGEREMRAGDVLDVALTGLRLRWEDFARDITYALRRLSKAPLFVSIVVLTFALGIGANVAVFSVLNAVVIKPLPFKDPNGIVVIFDGVRGGAEVPDNLSLADPLDMRSVPTFAAT
ncbi:MAG TPA: hypothetical protein VMH02_07755, partial [Verrucomicrobiae bacterium]|nr:hypothetical protein [Verrucomicrobiae bacterium]